MRSGDGRRQRTRRARLRGLLELGEGYTVAELEVEDSDWIAGRELGELTLRDAGIVVLGIHRGADTPYVGAPQRTTTVQPGDVLTVYGLEERVEALDRGRAAAQPGFRLSPGGPRRC